MSDSDSLASSEDGYYQHGHDHGSDSDCSHDHDHDHDHGYDSDDSSDYDEQPGMFWGGVIEAGQTLVYTTSPGIECLQLDSVCLGLDAKDGQVCRLFATVSGATVSLNLATLQAGTKREMQSLQRLPFEAGCCPISLTNHGPCSLHVVGVELIAADALDGLRPEPMPEDALLRNIAANGKAVEQASAKNATKTIKPPPAPTAKPTAPAAAAAAAAAKAPAKPAAATGKAVPAKPAPATAKPVPGPGAAPLATSKPSAAAAASPSAAKPAAVAAAAAAAVVKATPVVMAGGLKYIDRKVGTDSLPVTSGDRVTVKYSGRLLNGHQFDQGNFTLVLGAGTVIRGWDVGIQGMCVGGHRELTIPPALGYGHRGAPPDIPPNSTLVFQVYLTKVGEQKRKASRGHQGEPPVLKNPTHKKRK